MYNCLLGALPSLDSGTKYLNSCISLHLIHSVILVAIAYHSQLWSIQLIPDFFNPGGFDCTNVLVGSFDSFSWFVFEFM